MKTTFHSKIAYCWMLLWISFPLQPAPRAAGQGDVVLQLRRKQVELREARDLFDRRQELHKQELISQSELRQAETALELARLGYQEALLAALNAKPRISVLSAVKSQKPDGRQFVELEIANLTPALDASQLRLMGDFEDSETLPRELVQGTAIDIFVSLKDNGHARDGLEGGVRGTTIGLPYEIHVPRLDYQETRRLRFQLLKDIDSLIVSIDHRSQSHEIDLQLQQAETRNPVTLTSTQVSQEADLGSQVTYLLRLERSTVDVRPFHLKALNLPRQISYSFIDPASDARVSRFSFPAGVTQRTFGLRLFLPERPGDLLGIDQPLPFWAAVIDDRQAERFGEDRSYPDEEIQSSRIGRVRLEVIPRGVGRIEASATSLYSEIHARETASTELTVRNVGTRRLDNVKLTVQGPLRWAVEVEPELIPALEIDEGKRVLITVSAPPDAPVGDYEVRIAMESYANGRPVPSEEKVLRVNVTPAANLWGTATILGGLLLMLSGLLFAGVKLARR